MYCKHGLKYGECFGCDKEILDRFSALRNNGDYFFPYKLAGENFLCLACKVNNPSQLTEDVLFPLHDRDKFSISWNHIPQNFLEQMKFAIAKLAGFDFSMRNYYSHCWGCNSDISSELDLKCQICSWFICRSCKACGCDYPLNVFLQRPQESNASGVKQKMYYPILIRIMKAICDAKKPEGVSESDNENLPNTKGNLLL